MQTIYEYLGRNNLELLVNNFYELVLLNEEISPLFKGDIELIKKKQVAFLTQFLGGPTLYNETFGHPKMRMRHMPHKITPEAKDAWLQCMKKAIDSLSIEPHMKEAIYNCFPKVADHMVNTRSNIQ